MRLKLESLSLVFSCAETWINWCYTGCSCGRPGSATRLATTAGRGDRVRTGRFQRSPDTMMGHGIWHRSHGMPRTSGISGSRSLRDACVLPMLLRRRHGRLAGRLRTSLLLMFPKGNRKDVRRLCGDTVLRLLPHDMLLGLRHCVRWRLL